MNREELIAKMLELRSQGLTEKELAEALGITTAELRFLKNQHQMAVGKALRQEAVRMEGEGKDNLVIAAELGISEAVVRRLLHPDRRILPGMDISVQEVDVAPEANMWFPGPDSMYTGREGDYARSAIEFPQVGLINLVRTRIEEDGEYILERGLTGGRDNLMCQMMEWASRFEVIIQCFDSNAGDNPTVDWICRELAHAAKAIGGSRG